MIINITNSDLDAILTDIATSNGLSKEQYAQNIVTNFLEAQLRGMYATVLSTDSLTTLKAQFGDYASLKAKVK